MYAEFQDENSIMYDMVEAWNQLENAGKNPLAMDQYQLAEITTFSSNEWKEFLINPTIAEAMKEDILLLQKTKLRQLISAADAQSKSTGLAQIMTVLDKQLERDDTKKDGPAFIYCFVDLNEEEKHAPNVHILQDNPFLVEDEDDD